jgi:hypothetical protein
MFSLRHEINLEMFFRRASCPKELLLESKFIIRYLSMPNFLFSLFKTYIAPLCEGINCCTRKLQTFFNLCAVWRCKIHAAAVFPPQNRLSTRVMQKPTLAATAPCLSGLIPSLYSLSCRKSGKNAFLSFNRLRPKLVKIMFKKPVST